MPPSGFAGSVQNPVPSGFLKCLMLFLYKEVVFLRHDPFLTTLLLMGFTTKVVLPYKESSILETLMEGCYGSVGKVLAAQM